MEKNNLNFSEKHQVHAACTAASQRATAPLLATNSAAVLGRKQLAGDSKSKGAVDPKARQAQNQAESKSWREASAVAQTASLAPPALILPLLPHISPRQPATGEPQ